MTTGDPLRESVPKPQGARRRKRWTIVALVVAGWAAIAYLVAPWVWTRIERRHPDFAQAQRLTVAPDGHPGDPINLALVGSEEELVQGMHKAGWSPADPVTLRTSIRIAADSILRRPDPDAPVSDLFLFGRRQDLAFEQPVGDSPRQRHHVRYWRWERTDDGRPVWFGAATYDERVGLNYTTGQVTHHIGADVDAERDGIARELARSNCLRETGWLNDFHPEREGRNGGGDRWRTDGRLAVLTLRACGSAGP